MIVWTRKKDTSEEMSCLVAEAWLEHLSLGDNLKPLHPNPFTGGIYNDASHLYLTLAHRRPTFTADMTTYYCPNMEEPLRPATTGPLNAGISIGQIDLHKQAATTSRQIIAKISKRKTANFW